MSVTDVVCPSVVTSHSTATPQQAEYREGETVTVTCDLGHFLDTVSIQRSRSFHICTLLVFKLIFKLIKLSF